MLILQKVFSLCIISPARRTLSVTARHVAFYVNSREIENRIESNPLILM
jgi:hypothetical protein